VKEAKKRFMQIKKVNVVRLTERDWEDGGEEEVVCVGNKVAARLQ
jgi:hypothetical protein